MADLSPAAQAVLDAFLKAPCDNELSVAAALRAAAAHLGSCNASTELLTLAAELETH
jgi:hypothetical protein